ncbi:MAG: hypothetical protein JXA21_14790 [Anaerolineae bacterium]|nr:hypothetical protein [Anaerolineae bacterium]
MFGNRVRVSFGRRRGGPIGCILSAGTTALSLVCVVVILFFVFSALRSSDVVTGAVARAEADGRVAATLGTPLEVGWLVTGSMNTEASGDGYADLNIPVSGPRGKGTLHLVAYKESGEWDFSSLNLTVAANDETINLLER